MQVSEVENAPTLLALPGESAACRFVFAGWWANGKPVL